MHNISAQVSTLIMLHAPLLSARVIASDRHLVIRPR